MISQQRALVRMPDVVGLPLRKAKLLLHNSGLNIDAVLFQESYEARDLVLTQKPARGQMIYAGEKVTLTVSRESYVKWLPSIYQRADINGHNFFRDFLWIIQHLFGTIEEVLDNIHNYFDPYEAPEEFLPWLASWSAMVLEEDWPVEKKRRLIRKAIELYRVRGTVKGVKLFIALFTGHEPDIRENEWPFRGWRLGVASEIGVDSVVLPPVNLSHTFVVEMPIGYQDLSTEAIIRIHEIIQMEKPANTQYYLHFAAAHKDVADLSEFMSIDGRLGSGIGVSAEDTDAITSEDDLQRAIEAERTEHKGLDTAEARAAAAGPRKTQALELDDPFQPLPRTRPPLPKAPKADNAPVEGKEGPRSGEAGGFGMAARQLDAVVLTGEHAAKGETTTTSTARRTTSRAAEKPADKPKTSAQAPVAEKPADKPKTSAQAPVAEKPADKPKTSAQAPVAEKPETDKTVSDKPVAPAEAPKASADKPADKDDKNERKTRIGTPAPDKSDDDKKDPPKK